MMWRRTKTFNIIEEIKQNNPDITVRKISPAGKDVYLLFLPQITDREKLSDHIIKPLLQYDGTGKFNIDLIANSVISIDEILFDSDEQKIVDYVLKGQSVILIPGDKQYLTANTLKVEKRSIQAPEVQSALRSPRDAFSENFDANLSLIRYRIKDPQLKIDHFIIGKRTKTNVAVIYINDIANGEYVQEIKNKLAKINVDGIISSGYLQKFLQKDFLSLFPRVGIVERSDKASANLLEGKICIITEGSNFALIAPQTFAEFLDAGDDHYDNIYVAIFLKPLRMLALFLTLTLSSLWVMLVSFHPEFLPPRYILSVAASRVAIPFNAITAALVMETTAEILRESSTRLPKQIGPAIGIVGTIVIGQAAVVAGLFSPLLVIVVALGTMASFVAPEYTINNPLRLLKFFLLFLTGTFGLIGFLMGMTLILVNLISLDTFGVPYLAPFSPLNLKDLKTYFFSDITLAKTRPQVLRTKNRKRQ